MSKINMEVQVSEKNDFQKKMKYIHQRLSSVRKKIVFIGALGLATSPFAGNKLSAAEKTAGQMPTADTINITHEKNDESLKNTTQYLGKIEKSSRYENGNIMYEQYSSGATFFYYENGNLRSESQDGVKRRYDINNNLESVTLPCGTQRYYENGNIKEEELPYGVRYYNEDGSFNHTELDEGVKVNLLSDGSKEILYEDGIAHEKRAIEHQDGSWESYDVFFNKLEMGKEVDGTFKMYSPGGVVIYQYSPDGVVTNYDNQGQVLSQHIFSKGNHNSASVIQHLNQSQGR